MLYAALSGITEPIGALVGMFIFGLFIPQILVGFLMAAVGRNNDIHIIRYTITTCQKNTETGTYQLLVLCQEFYLSG